MFYMKVELYEIAQNFNTIFGLFLKKICYQEVKKSPNLVTLLQPPSKYVWKVWALNLYATDKMGTKFTKVGQKSPK